MPQVGWFEQKAHLAKSPLKTVLYVPDLHVSGPAQEHDQRVKERQPWMQLCGNEPGEKSKVDNHGLGQNIPRR